ncbi:MAG TPA: fused MFS/spermidine synthase [Thermoanaerobaculia bacterium]|nr:fused MFS/spermidine synthase [Thermoanaerobaculia bacterium]
MSRLEKVAIAVVVTLGGAVLMALEVAAFRIIGRIYGTALRETTTVIAVFLGAMSIGYFAGGRFADRRPRLATLGGVLAIAAPVVLAVSRFDVPLTEAIAGLSTAPALHAFVATIILFAIPTVLLASISPIAIRLLATDTAHTGRVAGGVSALSTIGSIAGTVVTAFLLIDLLGSIRLTVIVLAGATLLLTALLGAASLPRLLRTGASRRSLRSAPVLIASATAVVLGGLLLEHFAGKAGAGPGASSWTLFAADTPYHHVVVTERPPGTRHLYINGTLQSSYIVEDPHRRGLPYEEYKHFAKLVRPGLRRVLGIGLGGGTSARQFTAYYPEVEFDTVEIDPVVVDVAQRYFDVVPDDRLRLHVGDGRAFVRRTAERYDMITVDAYTRGRYGATIPPHLVTREFFVEAEERLNDGGILHFHCFVGRDAGFARSLFKTMAAVFPAVVVLGETELFASTAPLHLDPDDLRERAGALRERLPEIDERLATLRTIPPRTDDVPLLTDDFAPVDALLREAFREGRWSPPDRREK